MRSVTLLREKPVDLMVVIGGYNSSNTCNLARICAEKSPDVPYRGSRVPGVGRSHPSQTRRGQEMRFAASGWLPSAGTLSIGLTSGASTPDNLVGTTVERLSALCASL